MDSSEQDPDSPFSMFERRRDLRLDRPALHVEVIPPSPFQLLRLCEISFGGFVIVSDVAISHLLRCRFEFRGPDGTALDVMASVRHCHTAEPPDSGFVSGWAFEQGPEFDETLAHLLQSITA